MGLASALSTALTGLNAAETQIDVVGNNLANSQTVGFKASNALFTTQFLQTQGLGSGPSSTSGGTNPRQTGLGVRVAEVAPDFTQGTIEISSNPSDLAVQGDGFFIVQGQGGETLYTRNGQFKTNSQNELVTVSGNRLLGFGVDEFFSVQRTQLTPLTIPLGSAAVAQATQNVFLEGTLSPTGDLANTAEVLQSAILGDALIPRPDIQHVGGPVQATSAAPPSTTGVGQSQAAGASGFTAGTQYEYAFAFADDNGLETMVSASAVAVTVAANGNDLTLTTLPPSPTYSGGGDEFQSLAVYRRRLGVPVGDPEEGFRRIGVTTPGAASFTDNGLAVGAAATSASINGNYSYLVTFSRSGLPESRPSQPIGPVSVINGRIHLDRLPPIPVGPGIPAYDTINVYRNLSTNSNDFYHVASLAPGQDLIDSRSDADISDLTGGPPTNRQVNLDGPRITAATLLTNVIRRDSFQFESLFTEGTLEFQARKGGRSLGTKEFQITDASTVGDLMEFMNDALGIQVSESGAANPIPPSENTIPGEGGAPLIPGVTLNGGQIRVVSNNGVDNALEIGLSALTLTAATGAVTNPNMGFGVIQEGQGQSAVADFVVYDSLGIALDVRLTAVLEGRSGSATTYRWFADSPDNDPSGPDTRIAVGTGLVTFDGEGNLITANNTTVNIDRRDVPSVSPLAFNLDFSQISGLASGRSTLAASRQDGSSAGKLTSFIIGEDGTLRGVFSNGVTRSLGQIRLARFSNPVGLEQRGQNLYAQGVNSGLPVQSDPGSEGLGSIVAGATELSNTDIGRNLIDLVLATTQYRGNSRVISTAQQLLDELLNLRR